MRISDWSSDVCSSDLLGILGRLELDRRGATEPLARVADKAVARNARVEGLSDFDAAGRRVGDEIAAGKTGLAIPAAERRSDERRVGKECVSPCRSRSPPST